ncbi:aminopeptidase N [Streptomyces sp. TP-A0874]|uniref:aminopeptidase N n=1 Tax=Streptomyces sp. TP-A0874 TaxID=549819 RepID=UPI000853301F|nr:aminopeptidase N [Streptomyces sp. TP-A0874]
MSELTRDEAQSRARLIEVDRYTIDLDLAGDDELFGSTTTIDFTAHRAGDTFVELRPGRLHRVLLDGERLDPATFAAGRLPLAGLTPGVHRLRVEADMRYSRTGEGMHRFTDPADGATYLYTMCCMSDAPNVFACFDQPDLKAVFEVSVTAPADWTVLGNGIAERDSAPVVGDREAGHERSDAVRWRLAPTPPISTYLMAVVAGPYHSVRAEHAGLPLGLHVRKSLAPHLEADAAELLDITRRCLDRYQEIFAEPYPFDSYDQAFVPEFNSGAMENPGLVTFRDEFVFRSAVTETERQTRAMVIAHEMAHMWFGDLVTLRWWDDIWLNESFAEYMGFQILTEATDYTGTWTDFAIARKDWGYEADERPSTHPVAPEPGAVPDTAAARLNFDGISYAKGASALRQLVAWLGEKDFLAGINTHFARHRFGNATLADFIDSLADASGRDVAGWAEQWLRTTGVDILVPEITSPAPARPGAGEVGWRLEVRHTGSRPHRIAVTPYDRVGADRPGSAAAGPLSAAAGSGPAAADRLVARDRIYLDVPADGDPQPMGFPGARPDLLLLNDGDLSYTKIRFDQASWETVRGALAALPDPLSRAVVWNAARDMVREGELEPAGYLELARAHLPFETELTITQAVLVFTRRQIADRYLPPAERPAALGALTALCRDLLRRTEDGSAPGLRLTAVRTFIDSSTDTDVLRDWLTDGAAPGGPELDAELRWRLLARLSALGAATPDDIDAELRRDASATGQEGAARCRAALPDPRAKAAAWAAVYETDELSNYLLTATVEGFWQPEQRELLDEYVPRYFPAAVAVAGRRGPAIAATLGREGFPLHTADPELLRLGEECLRERDVLPALRRALEDRLDDLGRVLRVRGC